MQLSFAKKTFIDFRIHSELFCKEFLSVSVSKRIKTISLVEIAEISDGDHSKFPETVAQDIRYLQARDISQNFLEFASKTFVSKQYFEKNIRSVIPPETVLLSIMGTVGDIAITPKDFVPAMANRALAIIRNIRDISPQYLFAFLITKNAAKQLERLKNGGVQQRINLDVLGRFRVPLLSDEMQIEVEKSVFGAEGHRRNSKEKYAQAESLLLKTLCLNDVVPDLRTINIRSFNNSFARSGRLDAEYYQPKYENLLKLLKKDGLTIADVAPVRSERFQKTPEGDFQYLEIGGLRGDGSVASETVACADAPSRASQRVRLGDIITSTVRPITLDGPPLRACRN